MKVKVKAGGGMRGLIAYLTKDDSEFLAGTQPTPKDFLRETASLRELRPDCKKPVLHFSLSQPAGKENRMTDEQWQKAAQKFLKKMGLENHSYYAVRHNDTDHDHIHLTVNKIGFDGKLWDTDKSAMRAMAACTEIENEMGLAHTKTLEEFRKETGHRRNIIQSPGINEFRRTGKVKSKVQLAIQERKRKENEQNRTAHSTASRDHAGLGKSTPANHRKNEGVGKKNPFIGNGFNNGEKRTIEKNQQAVLKTPDTVGKRDSRTNPGAIDLFFFCDIRDEPAMRWHADEQRLDVLKSDPETILAALRIAQDIGIKPLVAYGSLEFQIQACKVAQMHGIEVKPQLAQALWQAQDQLKAEAVTARESSAREASLQLAAREEAQRKKAVEMTEQEEERKPGYNHKM